MSCAWRHTLRNQDFTIPVSIVSLYKQPLPSLPRTRQHFYFPTTSCYSNFSDDFLTLPCSNTRPLNPDDVEPPWTDSLQASKRLETSSLCEFKQPAFRRHARFPPAGRHCSSYKRRQCHILLSSVFQAYLHLSTLIVPTTSVGLALRHSELQLSSAPDLKLGGEERLAFHGSNRSASLDTLPSCTSEHRGLQGGLAAAVWSAFAARL